ncbi:MAG: AMP-binding protein, partial [Acidimicrobiaceae bacterium]|nr:AMP-binding protein [Acidimicrobiaceae bacterium]
ASFWDDLATHDVTWLSAVPTILARIPAPASRPPHGRLRFARSASSPLPPTLATRLEEQLGVPVLEAYGMTECTHQLASNPLPPSERKFGSVGTATGTEIRVVEGWEPVPAGVSGEVVVRGANVVDGYLDNPGATAESFRDGWFRTGDVGVLDEDGYLRLVGRIKELINRAGEKISPREVDEALLAHPDVVEAACYGVPDNTYGEVVHAAVVVRGGVTADELRSFCDGRIARFKVPAVVH